ncbi:hypothetical protein B6U99_04250, partial [Candidatus Geothermarchaeota archaeon ex4572_27]
PTYDCLTRCQYLKLSLEEARDEMLKLVRGEDTRILTDCVTCYACEEYCRFGNHPFYFIVEEQERRGILTAPKPIVRQWVQLAEPLGERPRRARKPLLSMCFFPGLEHVLRSKLFEGVDVIMGRHIFCNLVYLHFAKPSLIKERLPKVIDALAQHGVDEIIFYHDECYSTFTHYAKAIGLEVPFKPIHLFEFLYRRLKELEDQIKPLGLKVAYQRPCSSRLTPEKEHWVDRIFELIGVERVRREYDGENALCCGSIFKLQGRLELAVEVQRRNVEDMVRHGAQACIFNCPNCYWTLAEIVARRGIKPLLMSQLCQLAIGERPEGVPG